MSGNRERSGLKPGTFVYTATDEGAISVDDVVPQRDRTRRGEGATIPEPATSVQATMPIPASPLLVAATLRSPPPDPPPSEDDEWRALEQRLAGLDLHRLPPAQRLLWAIAARGADEAQRTDVAQGAIAALFELPEASAIPRELAARLLERDERRS